MVSGFLLTSESLVELASASISENGIISQNTNWTKTNSPYTLTGPLGIARGATLTIEPGVTVNIGTFYLEVNGTLDAQGTTSEQIFFYSNNPYAGPSNNYNSLSNSPQNIFMQYDNPTCIMQNVVLNQTSINGDSYISNATLTLIGCSLIGNSEISVGGSTTISNCYVAGAVLLRGASTVTDSTLLGGLDIGGGHYTFVGTYSVSDNNITNEQGPDALDAGNLGTVTGNIIWGGSTSGISLFGSSPPESTSIEKNLITNNQYGIWTQNDGRSFWDNNSTIQDNTIIDNQVGIKSPSSLETITNNNIENNSQYNIDAGSESVTAINNWWGTTDQSAISKSIFDSKNDFNLGTVTFTPFLTSPNNQVEPTNSQFPTPFPTSPAPTLTTSPTESTTTQNPTINPTSQSGMGTNQSFSWVEIGIFVVLAIIAVLLAAILVTIRKNKIPKSPAST